MQRVHSSKPVTHIRRRHRVGNLYRDSSASTSVSPPCIHDWRTASIHSGSRTLTSGLSLATNLYFGVSISPTSKCVTSEVRSSLCAAPICEAASASMDFLAPSVRYYGIYRCIFLLLACPCSTYPLFCRYRSAAQNGPGEGERRVACAKRSTPKWTPPQRLACSRKASLSAIFDVSSSDPRFTASTASPVRYARDT
jgi:hypothetical protein